MDYRSQVASEDDEYMSENEDDADDVQEGWDMLTGMRH